MERDQALLRAYIYTGVFAFLSTMLLTSIVKTIITTPGHIPEDKEWDMQTDSMAESSSDEDASNSEIKEDKQVE